MQIPVHQAIAERAYQLWENNGCSQEQDVENWLNAESELTAESSDASEPSPAHEPVWTKKETQSDSALAEKAAQQRHDSRAPITPQIKAPTFPPSETGKPLWSRPHSS